MGFLGLGRTPAAVSRLVPAGDRLMAWGTGPAQIDGSQTIVVATDRTFIAPGYLGPISWTEIARAEWSDSLLEIVTLQALQGLEHSVRIVLDQPGSVPQVVWERIESRIILQRHIELVGNRGARLIAKRSDTPIRPELEPMFEPIAGASAGGSAGSDLEPVSWFVVFDSGIDSTDPQLRERVDLALAELKNSAGI